MTLDNFSAAVYALKALWKLVANFTVAGTFATSEGKFQEGKTAYYAYFNIDSVLPYLVRNSLVNVLNST